MSSNNKYEMPPLMPISAIDWGDIPPDDDDLPPKEEVPDDGVYRPRWSEALTQDLDIYHDGKTIVPAVSALDNGGHLSFLGTDGSWAAGEPVIPTTGRSSWRVRIDMSRVNDGGNIEIGVCDAGNRFGWGLSVLTRCLCRWERLQMEAEGEPDRVCFGERFPEGWPDGQIGTRITDKRIETATGTVIEVIVEYGDDGTGALSFRIDDGPELPACSGFPKGEPLRPWAQLCWAGDRLRLV